MRTARKYLITLLIDTALVAWIAFSKDIQNQTAAVNVFHILCDAFFAVGVVTLSAGLLIFSTNEGTFDMLAYGMKSFIGMFKKNYSRKYETFYDYRTAREEKKIPFGFLLICGLLFLAISMVMLFLYHQYS